jgi:hypothetical protein
LTVDGEISQLDTAVETDHIDIISAGALNMTTAANSISVQTIGAGNVEINQQGGKTLTLIPLELKMVISLFVLIAQSILMMFLFQLKAN